MENNKRKFVVALPSFGCMKGFNCRTILVSAKDKNEAMSIACRLSGRQFCGDVKEVFY